MGNNYTMLAKTLFGLEDILAEELRQLGAMNIKKGVRSVSFEGDKGFMYKANLCLRTAVKILKPITTFTIRNEAELYERIYAMPWQTYMENTTTFAIDATLSTDIFNHSKYAALRVKDAIADTFRAATGKRPDVDIKDPELRINVHIQGSGVTVSLDSSGHSLHRRGYRTLTNIAPINEALAAGMLLLSGWRGQCNFLDPMCGSGTLLIEAAMIACNIPPHLNRKGFAFEKWPDFEEALWEIIIESSLKKDREFHYTIYGYDKAPSAIRKAEENIKNAGLEEYIHLEEQDFFKTEKPGSGRLHMVFNPPYGERLPVATADFYGKTGDTLKRGYPGTEAWLITSDMEALKQVGLRPSRKIKLFNGNLESRLVKYEMYEGSKKGKWRNEEPEGKG